MNDVVDIVERGHRDLEEQLAKLAATLDVAVARQLCSDLDRHLDAEEHVLYPVVAEQLPNGKLLAGEGEDDHAEIRAVVGRLRIATESDRLPGLVEELIAAVELHVDTEETEVLPQVRAVLEPDDVVALGRAFATALDQLEPVVPEA
jgi:hemerythrin-like domain-containing protein